MSVTQPELVHRVWRFLYPIVDETIPTWERFVYALTYEIRLEADRFYGTIERSLEWEFPGHDYTTRHSQLRLSDFPNHLILFEGFDGLDLTDDDISLLCRWEGTKIKREEAERALGVEIVDTTHIAIAVPTPCGSPRAELCDAWKKQSPEPSATGHSGSPAGTNESYDDDMDTDIEDQDTTEGENRGGNGRGRGHENEEEDEMEEDTEEHKQEGTEEDKELEDAEQDSEDELISNSVGVSLNERLVAEAAAAQDRGEAATLDPDFAAWMKEQAEHGSGSSFSPIAPFHFPPSPSLSSSDRSSEWTQTIPPVFDYGPNDSPPPLEIRNLRANMPPSPMFPGLSPGMYP